MIESSDPQDNTTYIDITDSHNIYNPTSNVVIIEYCEERFVQSHMNNKSMHIFHSRLVICINTEPMMFEGTCHDNIVQLGAANN